MDHTYTCQMCNEAVNILDQPSHIMNECGKKVIEPSYQVRAYYSDGTNNLVHDEMLSYYAKEAKNIRKGVSNIRRGGCYAYVLKVELEVFKG